MALGCIDAHFGNDGDVSREGEVVAHECDEVFNVVTREDLVGIVAVGAFGKDWGVLCRASVESRAVGMKPDVGLLGGGEGVSQMLVHSHATMLAIVQERAEPCRTPHRKLVWQLPCVVLMSRVRLERLSAIHSMYPSGGNPARRKGSIWSSGVIRSK